jgi:mannose-1-phosphate guanylyltransferase
MRAVLLAADPHDRLRPLTAEVPAAMVPLLDRPPLDHTLGLLRRQGVEQVIATVHRRADLVVEWFGDALDVCVEHWPLGSAGGVRACRALFGGEGPSLAIGAAVLTDLEVEPLLARHRAAGTAITVAVQRVRDLRGREEAVIDGEGRLVDVQPGGARPGLALCDALVCEDDVLDLLPDGRIGWLDDVLPSLADDGAVAVHEIADYWMDVGSPRGLRRAAFDLLAGRVELPVAGEAIDDGLTLGEGSSLDGIAMIEPPVWMGADVQLGEHVRLEGPLVIGDGATIGDGAQIRASVILPGAEVPRETVMIEAIAGHVRLAEALRRSAPRAALRPRTR